jgi:hypothetical protein
MKKISLFFLLSCYLTLNAQEVKWSGYGSAGYRNINKLRIIEYNQEMYFEAKLQAEIKINKNIESQIDVRGNSQDQQMELREVSIKFEYMKHADVRFGNLKKPFTAEQIFSEEDLAQIERSNLSRELSRAGYGGRSLGAMVSYESSGKKDDLPYSYYIFLYKNNSLQQGLTGRYQYHFDDDYSTALSYFVLHTGGDFPIITNAVSPGFYIHKKKYDIEAEVVLAQNPVEGIRRKVIKEESNVVLWGTRILTSISFDTGAEVIQQIEPLLMFSYFQPEIDFIKTHTMQMLAGSNFYFHKDVRARINFDFLLSRTRFSDLYSLHDSRVTLELQAKF